MHRVALHGIEIESEFAISGWRPDVGEPAGLRIERTAEEPPVTSPAVAGNPRSPGYSIHRDRAGFVIALPGVVRFAVERDSVRVHPLRACQPGELEPLLEGLVLATVLSARRELALHASAVDLGGHAVAFVGNSGAGKSTVAALLCASGARFVADDVLRVTKGAGGHTCFPGTARLRLRSRVWPLADLLPDWGREETHDARLALEPPVAAPGPRKLSAIVLPRFEADRPSPVVERLRGASALARLIHTPRIPAWTDQEVLSVLHAELASVVRTTPIYSLSLPRLAFDQRSASMLRDVLESI